VQAPEAGEVGGSVRALHVLQHRDRLAALALAETPARVVEGLIDEGLGFPPAIEGDAELVALLKTAANAAFRGEIPAEMHA